MVRVTPDWWPDPSTGQRVKVSGILGYHDIAMSTEDISREYGGYKFKIYGMLEKVDPQDRGGPPSMVDVAVAEFSLPTEPIVRYPLMSGEEIDMGAGGWPTYERRGGRYPAQAQQGTQAGSGQEVGAALSFAEKLLERDRGSGQNPAVLQAFAQQGQHANEQLRTISEQQAQMLKDQNDELRTQIRSMQEEIRRGNDSMQEEIRRGNDKPSDIVAMTHAVAGLNQSMRTSASSDELRALKEEHERAIVRMQQEHEREAERNSRERDREIERVRSEAQSRVERLEERMKDTRESFERRERDQREEYERRERSQREEFKRQNDSVHQSFETRSIIRNTNQRDAAIA
ncbi:MAG: hypothetical protein ACYTEQ_05285 [Planctomycetota bacterium]